MYFSSTTEVPNLLRLRRQTNHISYHKQRTIGVYATAKSVFWRLNVVTNHHIMDIINTELHHDVLFIGDEDDRDDRP